MPTCYLLKGEERERIPVWKRDWTSHLLFDRTKNARAGVEYKQDYLFTRSSVDLFKGPTLHGDAVVGYAPLSFSNGAGHKLTNFPVRNDGFLAGGEVAYDVSDARVTKYNLAFGYLARDYSVALHA